MSAFLYACLAASSSVLAVATAAYAESYAVCAVVMSAWTPDPFAVFKAFDAALRLTSAAL